MKAKRKKRLSKLFFSHSLTRNDFVSFELYELMTYVWKTRRTVGWICLNRCHSYVATYPRASERVSERTREQADGWANKYVSIASRVRERVSGRCEQMSERMNERASERPLLPHASFPDSFIPQCDGRAKYIEGGTYGTLLRKSDDDLLTPTR